MDTLNIITPINKVGANRTGTLYDINVSTINRILGFEPNVQDDPDKVVNSWGFSYKDEICGIWDYKGSHEFGQFSTFGPDWVFEELFGTNYG
jgi:hypothetical protein